MSRADCNPNSSPNATTALRKIIHEQGSLSFADFMALCLYHPQYGYYAQEPRKVGRAGDFFTSVSSGPLFGKLIAEHIASWWQTQNVTGPWRIIEPGPNNGDLARDILTHLLTHHPRTAADLTYVTIDPLDVPRQFQQIALASFGAQVQCLADTTSLAPLPGFVVANEVLDAFPCHLIQRGENEWQEIIIDSPAPDADLVETSRPFTGALPRTLSEGNYPIGYRTEIRESPTTFFSSLCQCLTHGRLLFFDYGFAATEYYDPQRTRGTLRVYRQHQASENPYADLGHSDITAHVDFSAAWHGAQALGMQLLRFEPQEFFLSRLTLPLVQNGLWQDSWQHNLQTLIHPSHLGGKFHAFELSIGEERSNDPTALRRLTADS